MVATVDPKRIDGLTGWRGWSFLFLVLGFYIGIFGLIAADAVVDAGYWLPPLSYPCISLPISAPIMIGIYFWLRRAHRRDPLTFGAPSGRTESVESLFHRSADRFARHAQAGRISVPGAKANLLMSDHSWVALVAYDENGEWKDLLRREWSLFSVATPLFFWQSKAGYTQMPLVFHYVLVGAPVHQSEALIKLLEVRNLQEVNDRLTNYDWLLSNDGRLLHAGQAPARGTMVRSMLSELALSIGEAPPQGASFSLPPLPNKWWC